MPCSPPAEHLLLGKLATMLPLGVKQLRARESVWPSRKQRAHAYREAREFNKGKIYKGVAVWREIMRDSARPAGYEGQEGGVVTRTWRQGPVERAACLAQGDSLGRELREEHGHIDLTLLPSLISC